MNVADVLFFGFLATLLMTTIMSISVALGQSRMSLPFLLGTMVTPDRNRAPLYGSLIHLGSGWLFAFFYAFGFESIERADWLIGAAFGLLHGLVVLTIALPILPGLHPRMASEHRGPEPTRALEPPGFLGLHYGRRTPLVTLLAHAVFGVFFGAFYHLAG